MARPARTTPIDPAPIEPEVGQATDAAPPVTPGLTNVPESAIEAPIGDVVDPLDPATELHTDYADEVAVSSSQPPFPPSAIVVTTEAAVISSRTRVTLSESEIVRTRGRNTADARVVGLVLDYRWDAAHRAWYWYPETSRVSVQARRQDGTFGPALDLRAEDRATDIADFIQRFMPRSSPVVTGLGAGR